MASTYQCNGTTSHVELRVVNLEHILAVYCHRSEGLVELYKVNVLDIEVVLGEELRNSDRRTDAHNSGSKTCNSGSDELGEDGLAQLQSLRPLHKEDGGGTIGDLTAVTASRPVTEIRESRANLVETLESGAPPGALVLGQSDILLFAGLGVLHLDGDGRDLVVEPASLLRSLRAAVRLGCVSVLLFTCDVEVGANVFRGLTHGLKAVGGVLVGVDDVVDEGAGETVAAGGHVLGAYGNTDLNGTSLDLRGDVLDSLEAGRAEAVDAAGSGGGGEAGGKAGGADVIGGFGVGDLLLLVSMGVRGSLNASTVHCLGRCPQPAAGPSCSCGRPARGS